MLKLHLEKLSASDLYDTGIPFIDPQDPALVITIGKGREFKTKRQVDAKTNAKFPESFDIEDITQEQIDAGLEIKVSVHNLNDNNVSKAEIGVGQAILKDFLKRKNEPTWIEIPLMHSFGENSKKPPISKGKLVIIATLTQSAVQPTSSSNEPFKPTEPAKPIEKQSKPPISINSHELTAIETHPSRDPHVIEHKSKSPPHVTIKKELKPTPMDETVHELPLSYVPANHESQIKISSKGSSDEKDHKSSLIGVGKLNLILERIAATDLFDTGSIFPPDPQDPAVKIMIGEGSLVGYQTKRKMDAKTNAHFDEVFTIKGILGEDIEHGLEMIIQVDNLKEDEKTIKAEIGVGKVQIRSFLKELDKPTVIEVPLEHRFAASKISKTKPPILKGKVTLLATLTTSLSSASTETVKPSQHPQSETKSSHELDTSAHAKETPALHGKEPVEAKPPKSALHRNETKSHDELDESVHTKGTSPRLQLNMDYKTNETLEDNPSKVVSVQGSKEKGAEFLSLKLQRMIASDLFDTGTIFPPDPQDPALKIMVGDLNCNNNNGKAFQTKRQKDAKTEAHFEEVFIIDNIPIAKYEEGIEMFVQVHNMKDDEVTSKAEIGIAKCPLKSLIQPENTPKLIEIPLEHRFVGSKKAPVMKGKVAMLATLEVKGSAPTAPVSSASKQSMESHSDKVGNGSKTIDVKEPEQQFVVVTIENMIASDLFDTGTIFPPDPQDPAVRVMVVEKNGNIQKRFHTNRQKYAKTDAKFSEVFEFRVAKEDVNDVVVQFEVNNVRDDENVPESIKAQIGVAKKPLHEMMTKLDEPTQVMIPLDHLFPEKSKKASIQKGRLSFKVTCTEFKHSGQVTPGQNKKEELLKSITTFNSGQLIISRIVCKNMPNVEIGSDENDPFVVLQFGTETFKTEHKEEAGANAVFDYLNYKFNTDKNMLVYEKLNIQVFDHNRYRAHTLIGEASVRMSSLASKLGHVMDITVPLSSPAHPEAGSVTIYGMLMDNAVIQQVEAVDREVDPKFLGGIFKINVIRGNDLHNKSLFSGFNPYVKLRLGEWSKQTASLNVSKVGEPIFEHLDMETYVTREDVHVSSLEVQLWNQGIVSAADSLVGSGTCLIRPAGYDIGQEVVLIVDLDKKGSTAGKLSIYAQIVIEDTEDLTKPIPGTFKEGYFHIKEINAHELKNVEVFRKNKQDPYVKLSFGESWKKNTTTSVGTGSIAYWSDLDFKCDVTKAELESTMLSISCYDENSLRTDPLIGSGAVSIRKGGVHLNEDVTVHVMLQDAAKKTSGRITIVLTVHPKDPVKLEVSKGFINGYIAIRKILARDIKLGMHLIQTPVLKAVFQYDEKTMETAPVEVKDDIYKWDYQDIKFDVTDKSIVKKPLSITLYEKKQAMYTATLDNLLVMGSQVGSEVEVDVIATLTPIAAKSIKLDPKSKMTARISLFATIRPPDALVKDEPLLPKIEPFEGYLYITRVDASELRNVEWFGKQDPFIQLSFHDWEDETAPLKNSGGDVIWNKLEFKTEVTSEQLLNQELVVKAVDKNEYLRNKVIGKGTIPLIRCAVDKGKEVELSIPIQSEDKKKKKSGVVHLTAIVVDKPEAEKAKKLPKKFTNAILHIYRIATFDLTNTEIGIGDQQDPYVKIKIGDFKAETYHIDNGGSNVTFEGLDIKYLVDAKILGEGKLECEAWDDNTSGDTFIGEGHVSLNSLVTMDEEVTLGIKLKNKRGDKAGRLQIFCKLEDVPIAEAVVEKTVIPVEYKTGSIIVHSVRVFSLTNTELLPTMKQSPYVELAFNKDVWTDRTPIATNGGADHVWDVLDMKMENISRDMLTNGTIDAVVKVKAMIPPNPAIGVGSVSIRRAAIKLSTKTELSIELTDPKKKKPAGRIVLEVEVRLPEPEETFVIPPNFECGSLVISRIDAFKLKNTEYRGLQDPFVKFKLGTWTDKTYTIDDAGDNATWNHINMGCDVYPEMVEPPNMLEIECWDENTSRANALIGTGAVSIMKCLAKLGQVIELPIQLVDEKNVSSGKIVIHACVSMPEGSLEVPDTFQQAELKIKRINAVGLKTKEFFGLKKGDPFMKVKLEDKYIDDGTKPLKNAGENPCWDFLDMHCNISAKTVKIGSMMVEAYDKHKTTVDRLLGTCDVPLRKLGANLGKDVEITGKVMNTANKDVGRLIILAQLTPILAPPVEEIVLPKDFKSGSITISSIRAFGLPNKEVGINTKQDPYCQITYGDNTEATTTKDNGGSDVTWKPLEMTFECSVDQLRSGEKLAVIVMDENESRHDCQLGSGEIPLRKLIERIGTQVEITIDLVGDSGAKSGKVTINAVLNPLRIEDANEGLPESAVKIAHGHVFIEEIRTFDLKGTDASMLFGSKDPYVSLELPGGWKGQTEIQKKAARNIEWKDLAKELNVVVTGDILKHAHMIVEVKDKSHQTISSGQFSLRKMASQPKKSVTHTIRLTDAVRHKPAGRLEIVVKVEEVAPFAEVSNGGVGQAGQGGSSKGPVYTKGSLLFRQCVINEVISPPAIIKMSSKLSGKTYLSLTASNWKGNSKATKIENGKGIISLHLKSDGIPIAFFKSKGIQAILQLQSGEKAIPKSDPTVASTTLSSPTIDVFFAKPNQWIDIKLSMDQNGKPAGTILLTSKFLPDGEEDLDFIDIHELEQEDMPSDEKSTNKAAEGKDLHQTMKTVLDENAKEQHSALQTKVNQLGDGLKKELLKELADQRTFLMDAVKAQSDGLNESIQKLTSTIKSIGSVKVPMTSTKELDVVQEATRLNLPQDLRQWRTAHVKAWVAFEMQLPQYIETFQKAAIDGLVLIKHVNEETLMSELNVPDHFHRMRILEGIGELQKRQDKIEGLEAKERMKALRKEQAMNHGDEEESSPKKKKGKKKKTKGKGKKSHPKEASMGISFGEHVIDKVRFDREMTKMRDEKKKEHEKQVKKSNTWGFEYTGESMKPPTTKGDSSIWDKDPFDSTIGSKTYRNMMTLDILNSKRFSSQPNEGQSGAAASTAGWMTSDQTLPPAPFSKKIETVPLTCTQMEVLGLVKAGMYDLSTWLLAMEKIHEHQETHNDSDVEDDEKADSQHQDDGDDEEEVLSLPPLSWNDMLHAKKVNMQHVKVDQSVDDEDGLPPLNLRDVQISKRLTFPGSTQQSSMKDLTATQSKHMTSSSSSGLLMKRSMSSRPVKQSIPDDRCRLVFNAMRQLDRNKPDHSSLRRTHSSSSASSAEKLTRLKFAGGIERLLRLKLFWSQFDALWQQLDTRQSGDIDEEEFKKYFGDLSKFDEKDGAMGLTMHGVQSKSMESLLKCLYELCDALRRVDFNVVEMFSAFDRNGSGEISISEFCQLLRKVVGNEVEKRLIYQAFLILDVDGNKAITLAEMLQFIYKIWKNQLNETKLKMKGLDDNITGDSAQRVLWMKEKEDIKNAIKKNFPRAWRDRLEIDGHEINGPFYHLFQRMNVGHKDVTTKNTTSMNDVNLDSPNEKNYSSKSSYYHFDVQPMHHPMTNMTASELSPFTPTRPSSSPTKRVNLAGQNSILRFKIKAPNEGIPTREGAVLTTPKVRYVNRDLTANMSASGEATKSYLQRGY